MIEEGTVDDFKECIFEHRDTEPQIGEVYRVWLYKGMGLQGHTLGQGWLWEVFNLNPRSGEITAQRVPLGKGEIPFAERIPLDRWIEGREEGTIMFVRYSE